MYIFQPDRYLLEKQIKQAGKYITGRVLDVGAGEFDRYGGVFNCGEYIRMDVNAGLNIDVVGSADNIPFADSSFDSVVSTQVFEHLANPLKAAKEVYRVLKTGGILLITVPQWNELHSEPHDYWRYTKFGIKELFEKQGFKMVEIHQRGGYFTTLAQMNIRYLIDRFSLYSRPFLGKIFNQFIKVFGGLMIGLDGLDKSQANRKHTIGWCAVFKKLG